MNNEQASRSYELRALTLDVQRKSFEERDALAEAIESLAAQPRPERGAILWDRLLRRITALPLPFG